MKKTINSLQSHELVNGFFMVLMFTLTLTPIYIYPYELTGPILTFTLLSSSWLFLSLYVKKIHISFSTYIIPILGLPIFISLCFTQSKFNIWTIHFINFIIFFLIVIIEKSKGNLSVNLLSNALIIVLVFELLKLILIKLIPGTFDGYLINDNIRSIFAVLCVPIIMKNRSKWLRWISILVVLIIVLTSESRTAQIGLMITGCFYAKKLYDNLNRHKALVWIILLLGCSLSMFNLQRLNIDKQESTDGRKIIWKNTIELIKNQPILGNGLGSYQKVFTDQLSNYFSNPQDITEKDNFKIQLSVAYNDPLQIICETGVIGVILILSFIFLLFHEFKENRISTRLIALTTFGVMCLFNYLIYSPPCFYILVLYLPLNRITNFIIHKIIHRLLLGFAIFWFLFGIACNYGFIKTTAIAINSKIKTTQNLATLKTIRPILGREEFYWYTVALNFNSSNRLEDAKRAVQKQISISSSIEGLRLLGTIEHKQGNIHKALQLQEKINTIIPGNIKEKINLYFAYKSLGNNNKASLILEEIKILCEKRPSNICNNFFVKY